MEHNVLNYSTCKISYFFQITTHYPFRYCLSTFIYTTRSQGSL